jgi:hypothetical protein
VDFVVSEFLGPQSRSIKVNQALRIAASVPSSGHGLCLPVRNSSSGLSFVAGVFEGQSRQIKVSKGCLRALRVLRVEKFRVDFVVSGFVVADHGQSSLVKVCLFTVRMQRSRSTDGRFWTRTSSRPSFAYILHSAFALNGIGPKGSKLPRRRLKIAERLKIARLTPWADSAIVRACWLRYWKLA